MFPAGARSGEATRGEAACGRRRRRAQDLSMTPPIDSARTAVIVSAAAPEPFEGVRPWSYRPTMIGISSDPAVPWPRARAGGVS